jgi:hypothetical protein
MRMLSGLFTIKNNYGPMKSFLKIFASAVLLLLIVLVLWSLMNMKDRNRGYKADLMVMNSKKELLRAGFSAVPITPAVPDRWTDINNNAEYEPDKGDTFTDGNGNGVFDPVWIAGFGNARAANGIHDDLWARTMVVDDGTSRIAIVVLDAIGFMNDDIIDIRKRIPADAGVTYTIVASTHTHEGPDLLGLWGQTPFKSGIDYKYMEFVKDQAAKSVTEAVKGMCPVRLEISQDLTGAIPLVKDTREPQVFDSGLRIIKAVRRDNGKAVGTLLSWADHCETLWSDNLLITSDFPHYFREYVEKGVLNGDSLVKPGTGGIAVFINGAIGGLMTTHPSLGIKDPFTGQELKEPTFLKADAQGKELAILALNAMSNPSEIIDTASISLIVRSLSLPIDNILFEIGTAAGLIKRGTTGWMKMRSELAVFNLGPLSFTTFPGEAYPELVNGGVQAPLGADFGIQPLEIPPVRDMMAGKYKFIFCLANDEIGYIIPKSQWDVRAPFTYGKSGAPYGEENSLGAETASILHGNLKEMLSRLNASD